MILNDSPTLHVRPARLTDANHLGLRLRSADLQEIQAVSGENPVFALSRSIKASAICYAIATPDDPCIALFGVIADVTPIGSASIWLLASPQLEIHAVAFLRKSHSWLEAFTNQYPILWNYVDARNVKHIRWLQWCGFNLAVHAEIYGVEQRPFYLFQFSAIG